MTFNEILRTIVLVATVSSVSSCSKTDISSESAPADVEQLAPTETQPVVQHTQISIFENQFPTEKIRGGAVYLGTVEGVANSGRIADTHDDKFAYLQVKRVILETGQYNFSGLFGVPTQQEGQSMIRIAAIEKAKMERIDVVLGSNETLIRQKGAVENINIVKDIDTGLSRVSFDFNISESETGEYRFLIYPSAAVNKVYAKNATGTVSVADVSLSKTK